MKFSTHAALYLIYGLAACGYFTAAGAGRWPGPKFESYGKSFSGSSTHGSSRGSSSYGRSWGGSWGGGK